MKQIKLTFLLIVLISMVGVRAFAYDFEVVNADGKTIYYKKESETEVAVTFYGPYSGYGNKYTGNIVIPETITYNSKTYSVIGICDMAFWECKSLTSVTIPNNVTSIGSSAFNTCTGLTTVNFGNGLISIGNTAFGGCTSMTSINIPQSVVSIGNAAFGDCSSLTSIIVESGNSTYDSRNNCNALIETASNTLITGCKNTVIPNTVTSISNYAFQNCNGLVSVIIPNSVTNIGHLAFSGCSNLTSVSIPYSVTSIGGSVFDGCSSLMSINVESGNTIYDSRNSCNAIIETASNTLITGCKNTIIPNTVTAIGGSAFFGCSGLTSISIPNSVTNIGESAFRNSGLVFVTIPNSVSSIGLQAFYSCSNLSTIYIPINRLAEWAKGPLGENKSQLAIKLTVNAANNAKYTTYYCASSVLGEYPKLVADENTIVYKAKQKNESSLTLTSIDDKIIPDATAVVLKTTGDEIVLRYTTTSPAGNFSDNILKGTNVDKAVGSDTYYVLGQSGANIGFFEFTGTTLAAHKAYIPASSLDGISARGLTMEEEEETTGIGAALNDNVEMKNDNAIYDLQGRRVEHPTKGIYIVNGKKVVIR